MGNADDTTISATLVEYLATIPDPRSRRGRRYEWLFLLTLIAAAMMMGESTLVGISTCKTLRLWRRTQVGSTDPVWIV